MGAGVARRTDVESIEGRYLAAPSLFIAWGKNASLAWGQVGRFLTFWPKIKFAWF